MEHMRVYTDTLSVLVGRKKKGANSATGGTKGKHLLFWLEKRLRKWLVSRPLCETANHTGSKKVQVTFTRADTALILLAPSAVLPGFLKRSTWRRNAARAWNDRMVTLRFWSKRLVHEAESFQCGWQPHRTHGAKTSQPRHPRCRYIGTNFNF